MSGGGLASSELICAYPGCKSSGRVFTRSYELERHKLIHFPKKKLVCPIQDCKHRKKGKSFTRDDKFREHIAVHGELASLRCPIPNCNRVQVKIVDFASHLADDHNIMERCEIKSLLGALRIDVHMGRWACPLLCDFTASVRQDISQHINRHDLSERIRGKSSLDLLRISLQFGRARCPICNLEVCGICGWVTDLYAQMRIYMPELG